jgi:hypothetical protein
MANWDCGGSCHHDGIHCYTVNGGVANHYGSGIYIYNNRFDGTVGTDNTSWLFMEGGTGPSSTPCADSTSPIYIFNNYFHPSDHPTNNGVVTASTGRLFFYNNTTVGYSDTTGYAFDCCSSNNGLGAAENNIWSTVDHQGGMETSDFNPIDYNIYADMRGVMMAPFTCNGTGTTSFSAYQAACGEVHGKSVSTADLNSDGSLQANSPAIGAGVNLTPLCTGYLVPLCSDINGNPRPASGAWDAGAFQASG